MASREAACACGQLKVECSGEPDSVSLCHCRACQRRTGGPFGIAAFFSQDRVRVTGESTLFSRSSESGHKVDFHFCPACGSTVFWAPARKPGVLAVAVGAFADPDFPAPTQEVHVALRHGWVAPLG